MTGFPPLGGCFSDSGGNCPLLALAYRMNPWAICRRLLWHATIRDCSRAFFSDGSRIEMSNAMMPITTKSSTSVNPFVVRADCGGREMDISASSDL